MREFLCHRRHNAEMGHDGSRPEHAVQQSLAELRRHRLDIGVVVWSSRQVCSACSRFSSRISASNKVFLAVEVDVERALRDAGDPRDLVHAGGVEAVRQEHLARAIEDLTPLGAVLARDAVSASAASLRGRPRSGSRRLLPKYDRTVRSS